MLNSHELFLKNELLRQERERAAKRPLHEQLSNQRGGAKKRQNQQGNAFRRQLGAVLVNVGQSMIAQGELKRRTT